ncbi:heavy-metal resistance protein CzcE [Cupriavidus metallidurans]|nr:CzcE family metal-binding protein [Cupriavidus metallidurans]MDE4922472.1 CzcE family metal-binding protein [Cupriavidus metallidurans]
MKAKRHALMFATILLGGVSGAHAMEVSGSKSGVSGSAAQATSKRHAALFGDPTDPSRVTRIVDVKPGLRYVNVDSGETVAFRSGEKISAWTFAQMVKDTSVDLGLLMPDLPGSAGVRVYLDRSDLFTGG